MPNIVIINDWINNLSSGGTYRIQGFAEGFKNLGFKVYITTPWGIIEYGKHDSINQPNVGSPLYYVTTSLLLPLQLIRTLERMGIPDLVLIQMPSPFTKALSILPILKYLDTPVILDFGDPWWKERDPLLYKTVSSKLIQFQANKSVLISSSSKLILRLIDHKNKVWTPNGINDTLFKPMNVKQDHLIGFLGSFTRRNGSRLIVPILRNLLGRGFDIKVLLVGGGDELNVIHEEAIKNKLSNRIIITGNVPRHRIPELLSKCLILVAPYMESPELNFIFPTKVPEMMALRRPVITARLYEIITTFNVGKELLVAKYDPNDYADKISLLLKHEDLRKEIAERGYVRIRSEFTWIKLARRLLMHVSW